MKNFITSITPVLQDFFLNVITFQQLLDFDVGRSQIEWNMKVKIKILICIGLMLNDRSNPRPYLDMILCAALLMILCTTQLIT